LVDVDVDVVFIWDSGFEWPDLCFWLGSLDQSTKSFF